MNYFDYKIGVDFWKTNSFDPNSITTEQLKEAWMSQQLPLWFRSLAFYEANMNKCIKSEQENKPFYPNPLDDEYLRTYIIPKLPTHNRTFIPVPEIIDNYKNKEWMFENFRDLHYIVDTQYVKKGVKESLKKNNYLPKGPYHSWLTRLIQYINTYKGETYIADILNFILDITNHNNLHTGFATEEECLPDFIINGFNDYAELKICSEEYFKIYREKLKNDFEATMKNDFHDKNGIRVVGALFIIKGSPLKIYSINLETYDNAQTYVDKTNEVDLSGLKLILSDDRGKIPYQDWPAIPLPLMFGLKASWLK